MANKSDLPYALTKSVLKRTPTRRELADAAASKKQAEVSPEEIARRDEFDALLQSEGWKRFLREMIAPLVHEILMANGYQEGMSEASYRANVRSMKMLRKLIHDVYTAAKREAPLPVTMIFGDPKLDSPEMSLKNQ